MGYAGFFAGINFSRPSCRCARTFGSGATFPASRKGRIVHEGKLNSVSDYLQAIVWLLDSRHLLVRSVADRAFDPGWRVDLWPPGFEGASPTEVAWQVLVATPSGAGPGLTIRQAVLAALCAGPPRGSAKISPPLKLVVTS